MTSPSNLVPGDRVRYGGYEGVVLSLDTNEATVSVDTYHAGNGSMSVDVMTMKLEYKDLKRVDGPIPIPDKTLYPHQCPKCGQPAYVGFQSIEHATGGCS